MNQQQAQEELYSKGQLLLAFRTFRFSPFPHNTPTEDDFLKSITPAIVMGSNPVSAQLSYNETMQNIYQESHGEGPGAPPYTPGIGRAMEEYASRLRTIRLMDAETKKHIIEEQAVKFNQEGYSLEDVIRLAIGEYESFMIYQLSKAVKKGDCIQFKRKVDKLEEIITIGIDYYITDIKDSKWLVYLNNDYGHWIDPEYCFVKRLLNQ
jgi:hypothetical protein